MVRIELILLVVVVAVAGGCRKDGGNKDSEGTRPTLPHIEAASPTLEGYRVAQDLIELSHLADYDSAGLQIDLGAAGDTKYIVGAWGSGWGKARRQGQKTVRYAAKRARLYFPVQSKESLTVSMTLSPVGTHAMTPYLNGKMLDSLRFKEGTGFGTYTFTAPAESVEVGENYLLLAFGGETEVGGERVSVAMDGVRIGGHGPAGRVAGPLVEGPNHDLEKGVKALAVSAPGSLRYYVEVPEQAKLHLRVGLLEGSAGSAGASVRVQAEGATPKEVLLTKPSKEWSSHVADLGAYAGDIVVLELSAQGGAGAKIGWREAAILVPAEKAKPAAKQAKNVVLLLIDTLRADKLRPFNPKTRVKTPVLDEVAERGVVFESAQSPENWTKPSVASVLTSLYPVTHGAKQSDSKLPSRATLISEQLKKHGFATGSFIANGYVSDAFGFDQGWDHYTNYIREGRSTVAENVFKEAADWIEKHADSRFFAYIQTIDPHVPYDAPDSFVQMYDPSDYTGIVKPRMTPDLLEQAKRNPPKVTFNANDRRRLEALHDAEISYHDQHLGVFIERLKKAGVWDHTLFVVTSDHGEEFNDHGSWGHGHSVYQELLHVPLLFHQPRGLPQGARVSGVVSTLDVAPSVLELLGVPPMPEAEGKSLVAAMRGGPLPSPQVAFSDFLDDRRVITTSHWKLILRGNLTSTLFDLKRDPAEQRELSVNDRPVAARYARILLGQFLGAADRSSWLLPSKGEAARSLEAEQAQTDDALREQLRALGYAN